MSWNQDNGQPINWAVLEECGKTSFPSTDLDAQTAHHAIPEGVGEVVPPRSDD